MIDWTLTKERHGIDEQSASHRCRVVAVCEQCRSSRSIKYPGYQFLIKTYGNSLCMSCRNKENRKKYKDSYEASDIRRAESLSKTFKKKWQEPNYRELQMKAKDEECRAKISQASKNLWKDDAFRIKTTNSIKARYDSPEYLEKIRNLNRSEENRARLRERWRRPGFRETVLARWNDVDLLGKFRESCRKKFEDPEFREKHKQATIKACTTEWRKKVSVASKKTWANKDFRHKQALRRAEQMGRWSIQELFYSILSDLGVKYTTDRDEANIIDGYRWDCRVDPQTETKLSRPLLVDVNGDYWHNLPRVVADDRRKATATTNHFDVDIKYVWEHEFHSKDRVISLVRNWLGIDEPIKLDFSFNAVQIREVELHDADLFISKWHYSGRLGRSGVKYGAFLGDILAAVCVYSQPVRQESAKLQGCKFSEILELSRFCIHPSYQKKNFASWFISRTVKMLKEARPKLKKLISFSDSTFNHVGTIYVASGWRLDGIVPPDYWYLDKDGYVAHKRTVWGHASRMKKTESTYVEECGYQKVWGKEKRRFILELV